MRLAKGVVFFFLMAMLGSCFNPPEFPIEPHIEFKDIVFKKVGGFVEPDSLILSITFKDGDGDLGIDPANLKYSGDPFNAAYFFLEKGGPLLKVATNTVYSNVPPLIEPDGQSGKLVTIRTRNKPAYDTLPAYNCYYYNYDSVYVSEENKNIFDKSYNLVDSLTSATQPTVYILLDTFYYEYNPNHYNITVKYEIKNSNGTYTEFDWRKELCSTFDGRFPVLSESESNVPLDGTLRYAMKSTGFLSLFGGKTLRLKVQIKDRGLHVSNSIYTKDFIIN